jgi:hypothetical protein
VDEQLINIEEKKEDFIGWKSEDGKLEVIGIAGKDKWGAALFKVTCTECSKDKELFPDGCFVSLKSPLKAGKKPCGCSKFNWEDWQFLILARVSGEKKGIIVHGFSEKFHGQNTKLNLECLIDGYKWTANINNLINKSRGCPKCAGNARPTEQEALQKCIDICKEMEYDVVGFPSGYKNNRSYFEYICKMHGKKNVSYDSFVNRGIRCNGCAISGYSTNKQGTFYVYKWTKDNHSFIKFGITNQKLIARIKKQNKETEYTYKKVWAAIFKGGSIPLYLENYIKKSGIEIGIMSKEEFPDGFTETIYIEDLSVLETLVTSALCNLTL